MTLYEKSQELKNKFNTFDNTFDDFSIGTKVKIITPCEDFYFFYFETGIVIENTKSYLGITVEFDKPRKFKDGYIQKTFSFNPDSLLILKKQNDDELFLDLTKSRRLGL